MSRVVIPPSTLKILKFRHECIVSIEETYFWGGFHCKMSQVIEGSSTGVVQWKHGLQRPEARLIHPPDLGLELDRDRLEVIQAEEGVHEPVEDEGRGVGGVLLVPLVLVHEHRPHPALAGADVEHLDSSLRRF